MKYLSVKAVFAGLGNIWTFCPGTLIQSQNSTTQYSVFSSDITVLFSYMMVLFLPLLRRLRDSVYLSVSKIAPKVLNRFY